MNTSQTRILWAFVAGLLMTQCISIGFSHNPPNQGLRVFMSPQVQPGSMAMVRLSVYDATEHRYVDNVEFETTVIARDVKMGSQSGNTKDGFLDQRIRMPRRGPAELEVWARWGSDQQRIGIPIALATPSEQVVFAPPWQAIGGEDPADARSFPPTPSQQKPRILAFPEAGWAVRNHHNNIVIRLVDEEKPIGAGWSVRSDGVETQTDTAGFAELVMAQPLNRGRYRLQIKSPGTNEWVERELWLHNPPAELAILPSVRQVAPGDEINWLLRSDRRSGRYAIRIHDGGQWTDTVVAEIADKRGKIRLKAPDRPTWVTLTWAADHLSRGRRRAQATVRVGDAPWPSNIDDELAHPATSLGQQALLRRIQPRRVRPPLRADTVIQRQGRIFAEHQRRRAWGLLAYDILASGLILWLLLLVYRGHSERKARFQQHAEEENNFEDADVSNWRLVGTAGALLGLLLLLYSIGYLLAHMQWSY
ncbi:MAG: hypothetical protein CMH58_06105 [Myxococcales bacterium]|jgi:hypothetical protein|nr:hypothetical protein [Myxococcales bacterium]